MGGALSPHRPPILALAATVIVWVTFERAPDWLSPDMQCVFFLAWSLPLAAWLACEAFRSPRALRTARTRSGGLATAALKPISPSLSSRRQAS